MQGSVLSSWVYASQLFQVRLFDLTGLPEVTEIPQWTLTPFELSIFFFFFVCLNGLLWDFESPEIQTEPPKLSFDLSFITEIHVNFYYDT